MNDYHKVHNAFLKTDVHINNKEVRSPNTYRHQTNYIQAIEFVSVEN